MKKHILHLLLLLMPVLAQATLIIPPENIGEMAANSDLVVYGEITKHTIDQYHNEFLITDVVSGNKQIGDRIIVQEYSGMYQGRHYRVSGDVDFELGQRYLLFLGQTGNGNYKANMLSVGVYVELLINDKAILAHPGDVVDINLVGTNYAAASDMNGSFEREALISHLTEIVSKQVDWNADKAGLYYKSDLLEEKHHATDFEPNAKSAGPCPNTAPCHCATLFGPPGANQTKFVDNTFTVCVAGGAQDDPTTTTEITDLQTAITTMNGMQGINVSYTGIDAACAGPFACNGGAIGDDVLTCAGGFGNNCNKIFVFFDDPCNQVPDNLDANCNGTLGIGGHFAGGSHTDLCGDTWQTACNPFFVMNNFGPCLPSTVSQDDYIAVLVHEMLHSMGVGHHYDATAFTTTAAGDNPCGTGAITHDGSECTGVMNPVLCNSPAPSSGNNYSISSLDNACTDWMYNITSATTCAITNVTESTAPVCNGDNAEFEICFDVTDGSGAYDIEVGGQVVVDAAAGATTGTNICVAVSVPGPTAAGAVTVNVRDDAEFSCLDNTNLQVTLPQCPPPCASSCADILNATAPDCGNSYYPDSGTYPGSGSTSTNNGGDGSGCQDYSAVPVELVAGSGGSHTICTQYTAATDAAAFVDFLVAGDPACIDQSITLYEAASCTDASTLGVTVNQPGGGFAGDASGLTPNTDYVICFTYTENGCGDDFLASIFEICPDIVETGTPTCLAIPDATVADICNGDDIFIDFGTNCTANPDLGADSGFGIALYVDANNIPTTFPTGSSFTFDDLINNTDPNLGFYAVNAGGCTDLAFPLGLVNATCAPIDVSVGVFPIDVAANSSFGDCPIIEYTFKVYPIFEAAVVSDGNCNPEVWALASDGAGGFFDLDNDAAITITDACGSEPANPTQNCTADIPYDFTSLIDANDPGCAHVGLTGTLSCICGPTCASSTGSTVTPSCTAGTFTVTLGSPTTVANQDGFLLVYDLDPSTPETTQEIYDDITGTDDPDIEFYGEQSDDTGTGFANLAGFNNPSCAPITVDVYIVPADITNGTIDPTCPIEGPVTMTIYPIIEAVVVTEGNCNPEAWALVSDGNGAYYDLDNDAAITIADACGSAPADPAQNCTADIPYDFTPLVDANDPGCSTNLTGTLSCVCGPTCASSTGSSVTTPLCSNDVFTVTLGSPTTTADQDGFLLVYDFDPTTPETAQEIYDDITGTDDPDIEFFGEQSDDTGAGFTNLIGFTNPSCGPASVDLYLVPADITNGTIDPSCAIEGPITIDIYPEPLTVTVIDDGSTCGSPTVNLLDADGNICDSQSGTCASNGDVFNYDFTPAITWLGNEPAACSPTGLSGSLTCSGCSSCPSGPTANASTTSICSGSDVTLILGFGTAGVGTTGSFNLSSAPAGATFSPASPAPEGSVTVTFPVNTSCDPIDYVISVDAVCSDNSDITGDPAPITVTVYPEPLTTAVVDDGSTCGSPTVNLLDADGNVCDSQSGTCVNDGDVFAYDFAPSIAWLGNEPAACSPTALSGTLSCTCIIPCTAVAPEPVISGTACSNGIGTGFPYSLSEIPGTSNPDEITEYIVLTGPGGEIIDVFSTLADAEAFINTFAQGTEFCIQAITHRPAELDALVAALDSELQIQAGVGLCVNLGPPCPNYGTLANLYDALAALGAGIDVATVEILISGDLNPIGVPIVLTVPSFCYDLSEEACGIIEYCCDAQAGGVAAFFQCPGDDIVVQATGAVFDPTTAVGYDNWILLTDANGNILDAYGVGDNAAIPYDDFENVYGGLGQNYCLYSYNFLTDNFPDNVPNPDPFGIISLATNVNDIGSIGVGCFDLSNADCIYIADEISTSCNAATTQGTTGGIGPFYYNIHEICIEGGTPPFSYNWETIGYVRHAIVGVGSIRIIYADNAYWSVTVTDSNGCSDNNWVFTNNTTTILDINTYNISPSTVSATCSDGQITVNASGGTAPYTYNWSGPSGWDGTGQGTASISNCVLGWYTVTIIDAIGDMTQGWYWVQCVRPGRGKLASDLNTTSINIYPNPATNEATLEFSVAQSEKAELSLYSVDGRLITQIANEQLDNTQFYQIPLNLNELPSGIYIVALQTASGELQHKKLVVTK